jgi:catechol 2,3-dioxygenase-like lactoylglutathione lyase family enzyme
MITVDAGTLRYYYGRSDSCSLALIGAILLFLCRHVQRGRIVLLSMCLGIGVSGCGGNEGGDVNVNETSNEMTQLEIVGSNAFWYYTDLDAATSFYTRTLGLKLAADYGFAKILHIAGTSYLTLVDGTMGMHTPDEPKTVALALVTDQLDEWWEYLTHQGVEMRNAYNPTENSAHDGFVAYDPEGYYLEFERFNHHPENERFVPMLERAETVAAQSIGSKVPSGLGFKATILWLYYRDLPGMEDFWEDEIGLRMVADQGWAKIYKASSTGFIGLVDETRGMHSYTEQKAVTISLWTTQLAEWFEHVRGGALEMRSEAIEEANPRYRAFVGYDPEGYYVEFDTFLPHEDNEELLLLINR